MVDVKTFDSKEDLERALRQARSKFEKRVMKQMYKDDIPVDYENVKIKFQQPAKDRTYTPDFVLPNGIILEAKGRLTVKARQKHKYIKQSHPDIDLRFIFQRPENKIYKGSKTSYADWAERWGFKWAEKSVPIEWLEEDGPSLEYTKEILRKEGQ